MVDETKAFHKSLTGLCPSQPKKETNNLEIFVNDSMGGSETVRVGPELCSTANVEN